jgi:beta-aspartyl-peptidase (threonine type)
MRPALFILALLASGLLLAAAAPQPAGTRPAGVRWALAIHGGAGVIPKGMDAAKVKEYTDGLERALAAGQAVLAKGGTALDAVERVVRLLEEDAHFNAGKGAVYTHDGGHNLDAAIMDGRTLACGAVAGLTTVRNPISLARLVMERSPHVFLAGEGAEEFAAAMQVERVAPTWFDTPERYRQWQEALEKERATQPPAEKEKGTVGAVALDLEGNLAAATSSGGMTNKRWGRIGDVPVIGAGTYASNSTCAVSCTGTGEEFIRHTVARDIAALIEYRGMSLQDAAEEVVYRKLRKGDGGIIAVGAGGSIALVFNSEGMFRGAADSGGRFEVHIWE